MIPLPKYIDPEAWEGFVEMRKRIKAPLTVRAATLVLFELQRIKDAGHDANASLDQSTMKCWRDVWPTRDKQLERKVSKDEFEQGRQQFEAWKARTPEEKARADQARQAAVALARSAIKRVG